MGKVFCWLVVCFLDGKNSVHNDTEKTKTGLFSGNKKPFYCASILGK